MALTAARIGREIGLVVIVQRCRHGDDEDIRRLRLERGPQPAGLHRRLDQHVEVRLLDMDLGPVDGVDHMGGHVDTEHVIALGGQERCRGQPDIAESEHADPTLHGISPNR